MTNLTPEQQAVIDAAVAWRNADVGRDATDADLMTEEELIDAVDALLSTPEYREKNDG